jgi:hypothetical protein
MTDTPKPDTQRAVRAHSERPLVSVRPERIETAEAAADRAEAAADRVQAALASLPVKDREVLELLAQLLASNSEVVTAVREMPDRLSTTIETRAASEPPSLGRLPLVGGLLRWFPRKHRATVLAIGATVLVWAVYEGHLPWQTAANFLGIPVAHPPPAATE